MVSESRLRDWHFCPSTVSLKVHAYPNSVLVFFTQKYLFSETLIHSSTLPVYRWSVDLFFSPPEKCFIKSYYILSHSSKLPSELFQCSKWTVGRLFPPLSSISHAAAAKSNKGVPFQIEGKTFWRMQHFGNNWYQKCFSEVQISVGLSITELCTVTVPARSHL